MMMIKGCLQASMCSIKAIYLQNLLLHQNRPQTGGGLKFKFWFCNPKTGKSLCRTMSFDIFFIKIHSGVLAVGDLKNQKLGE